MAKGKRIKIFKQTVPRGSKKSLKIPKWLSEASKSKKVRQYNGQKDKQWSSKQYTEN